MYYQGDHQGLPDTDKSLTRSSAFFRGHLLLRQSKCLLPGNSVKDNDLDCYLWLVNGFISEGTHFQSLLE